IVISKVVNFSIISCTLRPFFISIVNVIVFGITGPKIRFKNSNPIITRRPEMIPISYMPPPMARPIPAVAQTPAAVVKPCIEVRCTRIIPAPKKPIPLGMAAATRLGSRITSSANTSKYAYFETSMKTALPIATRKCVRRPASLKRFSRSKPINAPIIPATHNLIIYSYSKVIHTTPFQYYFLCLIRSSFIISLTLLSLLHYVSYDGLHDTQQKYPLDQDSYFQMQDLALIFFLKCLYYIR